MKPIQNFWIPLSRIGQKERAVSKYLTVLLLSVSLVLTGGCSHLLPHRTYEQTFPDGTKILCNREKGGTEVSPSVIGGLVEIIKDASKLRGQLEKTDREISEAELKANNLSVPSNELSAKRSTRDDLNTALKAREKIINKLALGDSLDVTDSKKDIENIRLLMKECHAFVGSIPLLDYFIRKTDLSGGEKKEP